MANENNSLFIHTKSVQRVYLCRQETREASLFHSRQLMALHESTQQRVTFCWKLSVTQHFESLLAASAQTLFTLRRHHGMPPNSIQTVFQVIVIAKLSYVTAAWWGFAGMADRNWPESFLLRSVQLRSRYSINETSGTEQTMSYFTILFIGCDDQNLLYLLFPLEWSQHALITFKEVRGGDQC